MRQEPCGHRAVKARVVGRIHLADCVRAKLHLNFVGTKFCASTKAVRGKDSVKATSGIAADILTFDVVNPLQQIGSDASRKRAEEWFSSFRGPIDYETRDMNITAGDDVAFSHGLCHVSATKADGEPLDMWWRSTTCFRKIDGNWMVTHVHNSVPFDPKSGKASLDLKP